MKITFKIHPFFYILALICIFTGYFKNFIFITFIILFHELGHILCSMFFNWKIDKVIVLPFGCLTLFDEYINRPIKEELLIAIIGPIFQSFLFLIDNALFRNYNLNLLLFNLLPILPLDGSKILNLLLNKISSFKTSHLISIIISIIFMSFLFYFKFNLILYLSLIFLIYRTYQEYKNHNFLFNRFLFERYIYHFNFKKEKIIKKNTKMKRDYRHIIYFKNKYITERNFLAKLFDN